MQPSAGKGCQVVDGPEPEGVILICCILCALQMEVEEDKKRRKFFVFERMTKETIKWATLILKCIQVWNCFVFLSYFNRSGKGTHFVIY